MTERSDPGKGPRALRLGYALALVASAAFVIGGFLPFYGFAQVPQPDFTASLYQLFARGLHPDDVVAYVGGLLYLFSGIVIVGVLSIIGLRSVRARWVPVALAGTVAAWSLVWFGVLLSYLSSTSPEIGFWVVVASVCLVVTSTGLVLRAARHRYPPR